jgi:hypothetical protein
VKICLECGRQAPVGVPVGGNVTAQVPQAGDPFICYSCSAVTLFTGRGDETRRPLPQEAAMIARDREIQALRARINAFRRGRATRG